MHPCAEKAYERDAESKQTILVKDEKLLDASVKKQPQKPSKTGLAAVESGADVGNDFITAGLTQALCLPHQIRLLIMRRDARIADNFAFGRRRLACRLLESPMTAECASCCLNLKPLSTHRLMVLGDTP